MSKSEVDQSTCTAPSSRSWSMPFLKFFCFEGFGFLIQLKSSGEKVGMPSYWIFLPMVRVSPMEKAPGLTKPTMSPAYAVSTVSRRCAKSFEGAERRTVFPVRVWRTCMSLSNRPLHTLTNAMRSLCFGSMFAWSLNTKPVNSLSSGGTESSPLVRGEGGRERSMKRFRNVSTPKLLYPLPNHTGVCFCARTSSMSRGSTISSRISSSSLRLFSRSSGTSSASLGSSSPSISISVAFLAPPLSLPKI
mmetsp:Transcript_24838/g.63010  ORF Transcript_24838/g.63010 Transcript_24838/m.63010 type:complete len:247 (-) Transcript_24838:818-1558(-)